MQWYNSLVHSYLEYACFVWNPKYQFHMDRIRVQRTFTRFLSNKNRTGSKCCDYDKRLEPNGSTVITTSDRRYECFTWVAKDCFSVACHGRFKKEILFILEYFFKICRISVSFFVRSSLPSTCHFLNCKLG